MLDPPLKGTMALVVMSPRELQARPMVPVWGSGSAPAMWVFIFYFLFPLLRYISHSWWRYVSWFCEWWTIPWTFSLQAPSDVNKTNGANLLLNDQNKYKSMLIRTYSSLWMMAGFVFLIYMGHLYIWAMVVVIQIFMASELFNLLRKANEDRQLPGFRLLNW